MSDCFALLGEPRRPWLEAQQLKEKFLALSSAVHPDRVHNAPAAEKAAAQERYVQLNAAYQCLREPKTRLQHLLELETGAKPSQVQSIPSDLMEPAQSVGQLCRQADSFLAQKRATVSPLLQVQFFEQAQEWTDKLVELQTRLQSRRAALETELKALDATWVSPPRGDTVDREVSSKEAPALAAPPPGPQPARHDMVLLRLEELYRLFSYFGRWDEQLQERLVQLSF